MPLFHGASCGLSLLLKKENGFQQTFQVATLEVSMVTRSVFYPCELHMLTVFGMNIASHLFCASPEYHCQQVEFFGGQNHDLPGKICMNASTEISLLDISINCS